MNRVRAAVVGGSGYIGGELVRLLLQHPAVELTQVTSESQQGKFLHHVHPNLRQQTRLKFVGMTQLEVCDVLFLALPHGMAQKRMADFQGLSERIIDLSSDFFSETRSSIRPGMDMITPVRRCCRPLSTVCLSCIARPSPPPGW